jgi:hypothetical protein
MGHVLLGLIMAYLAASAALAGAALWVDPFGSIATLVVIGAVVIVTKGTAHSKSTFETIGVVSIILLGAYGLHLCGAPLGWCIAALCTGVGLIIAGYLLAMYALSPEDEP